MTEWGMETEREGDERVGERGDESGIWRLRERGMREWEMETEREGDERLGDGDRERGDGRVGDGD